MTEMVAGRNPANKNWPDAPSAESRKGTTFELFQRTGRDCDDLEEELSFLAMSEPQKTPIRGRVYMDALIIEDTTSWDPKVTKMGEGKWFLILDREETYSDDLESIEKLLWEYYIENYET